MKLSRFLTLSVFVVLSSPFFVAGFVWSFARQGFDDGVLFEKTTRRDLQRSNENLK